VKDGDKSRRTQVESTGERKKDGPNLIIVFGAFFRRLAQSH
jgi:hypothetical protein